MHIRKEILDFWFDAYTKEHWFKKSPELDKKIKAKFGVPFLEACELTHLSIAQNSHEHLAEIILFDQIPRHLFRDSKKAFDTDHIARKLTYNLLDLEFEKKLNEDESIFAFMPLMHSEKLEDQEFALKLYEELGNKESCKFAKAHYDIIKRFGRFPHRNKFLGRKSTEEEIEFLKTPNSSF